MAEQNITDPRSTWSMSDAGRGTNGAQMGGGSAFSDVKGAAEENVSTAGRETWNMSNEGRGVNGAMQVHGVDSISGMADTARNAWDGSDPATKISIDC